METEQLLTLIQAINIWNSWHQSYGYHIYPYKAVCPYYENLHLEKSISGCCFMNLEKQRNYMN